jgi:8-oxo-dGTP pyrophosphatase MutT (NUDIX family)
MATPAIIPRRSASLIIVDHSEGKARVLMGRRNPKHDFMPNVFVFPGGGIEAGDRRMNVCSPLHEVVENKLVCGLPNASPAIARALALAAIRETFEETGLVIGADDCGRPEHPPEGAWSAYAAYGVFPDLADLHLIARAITPAGMAKRYDTVFFAVGADRIAAHSEGHVGPDSEFTALAWVDLADFGDVPLAAITRLILAEMKKRLENGMSYHLPWAKFGYHRQQWMRQEI